MENMDNEISSLIEMSQVNNKNMVETTIIIISFLITLSLLLFFKWVSDAILCIPAIVGTQRSF